MEEENKESSKEDVSTNYVSKLAEVAERIEKANAKAEENLKKQEELIAFAITKQIMGGKTDAGIQPVEKKPETAKEYKDRILKGQV